MHLDHDKFVDLLVETSGIDKKKVVEQLKELVEEVNAAMAEGEAYEIEGFGVFMLLGNKINFVPSKGLETEINYKYAGMQPIDLSEEDEKTAEQEEDPFAFLETDEEESVSGPGEQEQPGPEKWGIDTYKDEEGASNVFGALMGEEIEKKSEKSQETDSEEIESPEEESAEESLSASKEEEKQPEDEMDDEDFDPFAIAGSEFKDPGEEEEASETAEDKKKKEAPYSKAEQKKPKEKIPVIKGVGTKGADEKKKPDTKSRPVASHSRAERNQSSPILLIVVIIAVLGAVAFGAYQFGLFSSFEESEQVTQTSNPTPPATDNNTQNQADSPIEDDANATNVNDAANTNTTVANIQQNNAPEEEQTQTTPTTNTEPVTDIGDADWGLTGQPQEMLNSGYTINRRRKCPFCSEQITK